VHVERFKHRIMAVEYSSSLVDGCFIRLFTVASVVTVFDWKSDDKQKYSTSSEFSKTCFLCVLKINLKNLASCRPSQIKL
jgi:hypothetical protein